MIDRYYEVAFKLLDVLKALAVIACIENEDAQWLEGEIQELEKRLFGDDETESLVEVTRGERIETLPVLWI